MKSYSKEDCRFISIISWSENERYIREKTWYRDVVFLPFENILIPAPVDYDLVLKKQFGDYMIPVKGQSMHGTPLVMDVEHSYLDYLPKLRKQHKRDKWKYKWKYIKEIIKF